MEVEDAYEKAILSLLDICEGMPADATYRVAVLLLGTAATIRAEQEGSLGDTPADYILADVYNVVKHFHICALQENPGQVKEGGLSDMPPRGTLIS